MHKFRNRGSRATSLAAPFYGFSAHVFMTDLDQVQDMGMLVRVLASYVAWLLMMLSNIPAFISVFIVIAAPLFFGSVIWHLRKRRSFSLVNRVAFCGAVAFFPFLAAQMWLLNH